MRLEPLDHANQRYQKGDGATNANPVVNFVINLDDPYFLLFPWCRKPEYTPTEEWEKMSAKSNGKTNKPPFYK
jgi:hypothetical protein